MDTENKVYLTAQDLCAILGISTSHAYKIIRQLNGELKRDGYLIISGKLPIRYFEKRWYGYGA